MDLHSGRAVRSIIPRLHFHVFLILQKSLRMQRDQEELPPERRTVLCIYGAVRGVGGIDSWGSDVEEQYRIPGNKDIEVEFIM